MAPPPAGPPPPGGDVDLGTSLTALVLSLSILAFVISSARVWIRFKDRNLGAEDFCSFMAAVRLPWPDFAQIWRLIYLDNFLGPCSHGGICST